MTIDEMEALCEKHNRTMLFNHMRLHLLTSDDWQEWKPEWVEKVLQNPALQGTYQNFVRLMEKEQKEAAMIEKQLKNLRGFQKQMMKKLRNDP